MYRSGGADVPTSTDGEFLKPFTVPLKATRRSSRVKKRVSYKNILGNEPEMPVITSDPVQDLSRPFRLPLKTIDQNKAPPPCLGMKRQPDWAPKPLYDPCGEFAIVLYDPTLEPEEQMSQTEIEHENLSQSQNSTHIELKRRCWQGDALTKLLGEDKPPTKKKVKLPVVIDPKLARILRPHQVEGVKFLYRCTMGLVDPKASGCIMADEMGLGKTLQCITLMWTLLKQSPEGRKGSISKAIVVCPSSLVRNWANELDKWLGVGALNSLAADGKSVKPADLGPQLKYWADASGRQITRPVLIISYETLRRHVDDIKNADIGLLLADEGHRLKNGDSLTFTALDTLNVKRRVILSGTPIQNDLSEYFSLVSFANPGLLGNRQQFRRDYEIKILRGRDADATDSEIAEGDAKLRELLEHVTKYIIRRTNDILSKYLPVKFEHVVFCGLTDFQTKVYKHFLESREVGQLLKGNGQPLYAINILKKLCTHPDLLDLVEDIRGVSKLLPSDYIPPSARSQRDRAPRVWYSGKFLVLARMLARIREDTDDKIVLISNYTQTLDMIENMCRANRYGCLRLDGSMAVAKRQRLVDRFNNPSQPEFIFLLSSKAGGCGINLIGANRLILLDPDWNPAADQQALARVWRDGQKKTCFVYRFIATGTIEEKIFQRQTMKQQLSSAVVDENVDVERVFSADILRKLFLYNSNTKCDTHETFKCRRCSPEGQLIKAPAMLYGDAKTWNHFPAEQLHKIEDKLLQQESSAGIVNFVFQYISH